MTLLSVQNVKESYKKRVVGMEDLWDVVIILSVSMHGKSIGQTNPCGKCGPVAEKRCGSGRKY